MRVMEARNCADEFKHSKLRDREIQIGYTYMQVVTLFIAGWQEATLQLLAEPCASFKPFFAVGMSIRFQFNYKVPL